MVIQYAMCLKQFGQVAFGGDLAIFVWRKGVEMKFRLIVIITVLLMSTTGVYAELHDRGGGLIYDDVLDITWLQDTNYAMISGYDSDGLMNWSGAMNWAAQLVYAGFNDWRLPRILPVNGISY